MEKSEEKENGNESSRVRKRIVTFALIILWTLVSTTKQNFTKYVLQIFPHPLTVSLCNTLFISMASVALLHFNGLKNWPVSSWRQFLLLIIPITILRTTNSLTGDLAQWKVSVAFFQIIRGGGPIFTILLCRIFLGVRQRWRIYMSLIPFVIGFGLCSYTDADFNTFGVVMGIACTFTQSGMGILQKQVMGGGNKLHKFETLALSARLSCIIFIPIWAIFDGQEIIQIFQTAETSTNMDSQNVWWILLLLLGVSSLRFMQEVCFFSVLHLVTPTSQAVADCSKRVFSIVVGIIVFSTPVSILNGVGMSTAIFGLFLYSYFRVQGTNMKSQNQDAKQSETQQVEKNKPTNPFESSQISSRIIEPKNQIPSHVQEI